MVSLHYSNILTTRTPCRKSLLTLLCLLVFECRNNKLWIARLIIYLFLSQATPIGPMNDTILFDINIHIVLNEAAPCLSIRLLWLMVYVSRV